VTLGHGSPGIAEAGLERGGIAALVERSLSSEAIRAWKPAREVYLWAAGTCDVAPDRMALVAAHGWDVLGAQRAGLTGAWFPRSERVYPAVYEPPHVTATDLAGVVDALLALPA
jgi:2-haloacid dehalogenase